MINKKSFTLIELLVVIAIIGILVGIIIVAMTSATGSALDARRKTDIGSLVKSITILRELNGGIPSSTCTIGGGTSPCTTLQNLLISKELMKSFPIDPSGDYYEYKSLDGIEFTITGKLSTNENYLYSSQENKYSERSPLMAGWSKRKSISITNSSGSTLTDYQVSFTVTYDSDMQADFDDLRFTNSEVSTILPYWIENKTDGASATVWVKIPTITTSNATIYMYYGNSGAASISNISNVFIRQISGNVLSLSMDEGSGTSAYDKSGTGKTAALNGNPVWKNSTSCVKNNCLGFNGSSSYLSFSSSPFAQSSAISYSFWFNIPSGGAGGNAMGQGVTGGHGSGGVSLYLSATSFMWTPTSPLQDRNWSSGGFNLSADAWHHIVYSITFAGTSTCKIYIDGIERAASVSSALTNGTPVTSYNNATARIGGRYINSMTYFNGSFDEVNIYNRALTQAEALDLYNNYGYGTLNLAGTTLIRKSTSIEPTYSFSSEENN